MFYGDNAQGKTNILESVYMAATARSHRGTKDRDILRFGEEESHIKLFLRKRDSPFRIDMHLKKNKAKGVALNSVPIRKVSQLFGVCHVVFFSPEDLNMIKRSPQERRRFMDLELCQLNTLYVSSLVSYNRVLDQRNRLLKDIALKRELEDTLEVWDLQLVRYGGELIRCRGAFIEKLNAILSQVHFRLSGGRETMRIVYVQSAHREGFLEELKKSRSQDIRYGTTNLGPHRDDIAFFINETLDLKKFGSQGQQRSGALSLKLSEIEMVQESIGDSPILLLDDVLSELDSRRQRQLLEAIQHVQTFITCTGVEDFVKGSGNVEKIFHVQQGTVQEETSKGENL